MAERDFNQATYTDMASVVDDYSVSSMNLDEALGSKEVFWINQNWPQYLGYYKQIPELKQAIDALARWTAGKGWVTTNPHTKVMLDYISGWGEDTFDSIMQNLIVTKKINGDAFAEIIRSDKRPDLIINLKPLNPSNVRIVCNLKGIILRYEEYDPNLRKAKRTFKPSEILHLCNDRVANEIHGTSVVESCKWIIDAKNEAMADWRRMLHRSSMRVAYVDADDASTLSALKTQYAEAIKYGELMILPGKKGSEFEIVDYPVPPAQPYMDTIRYYENFFYQAVGVPKVILGGSQDYTEASSKVGYLTFEQVYMTEQSLLEQDLWNQLGIKIKFQRPVSLKESVNSSEAANTGQVGIQENEVEVGVERTE